ncbi:condensation domain-containing protein [Pseudoalteromonas rubra]|uniref:condensation domain-containing protein n=1 Tax=Pseudoalteromonas rubra TaxID=43658 RepID=UPI000F7AF084|nr:condensation domain-containing protein [Pseudoalteromonas rubra]
MTDLEKKIQGMSAAKQAMLRKMLKGKAVKLDEQQAVQTMIAEPEQRYTPYAPRSFQLAQLKAAAKAGTGHWFFMETQRDALDIERFVETINQLVAHHTILHSIQVDDGQSTQLQTRTAVDWQAHVVDLRGVDESCKVLRLAQIRAQFEAPRAGENTLPFMVTICQLDNNQWQLFVGADLMLLDLVSVEFLALQWRQLYEGRKSLGEIGALTFRDYCQTERAFQKSSREWQNSRTYWTEKLADLPPVLTGDDLSSTQPVSTAGAEYRVDIIDKSLWMAIKAFASDNKLTGSMVIYSLFTLALAGTARLADFTLEMRLFNRISFDAKVNDILGQYSSGTFSKVEIDGQAQFVDYCRQLESQTWADLDNGFYDVVSEQALTEQVKDNRIVFTSTISRYSEFVEEGVVPPMKWFGAMHNGVAHVPGQALELLIVENANLLELHWFIDHNKASGGVEQVITQTASLIKSVAQAPERFFECANAQLVDLSFCDCAVEEA